MAATTTTCLLFILALLAITAHGGQTSTFTRTSEAAVDIPLENLPPPPGYNAPEQVHIMQGDHDGRSMIVSWVTPLLRHPNGVKHWEATNNSTRLVYETVATITYYRYYNYTSGYIHHATLKDLKHDTKYQYKLTGSKHVSRTFSFTTPPTPGPDVPYTFGIIGDLGQTFVSNQTLEHYLSNPIKGQAVLFAGDLSYADHYPFHDNRRWDSFARLAEKSTAYQPWIITVGNHEIDFLPEFEEYTPFKPYTHRYRVPYRASKSTSPLWYSIKRASSYIIALSSYSAYSKYSPQHNWLENELTKVDRNETPWLIVLLHSPWYNSNKYHYMEGESMRVEFEPYFVKNKVDLVLSGHVHSYERSERVSNVKYNVINGQSTPVKDASAPVYITIGDGGNIEGIANSFTDPQPEYSAFREASFGHATLEIKNRTHAYYTWHRNQDAQAVAADSIWFYNRFWYPQEEGN
ncbi:purple acid phosphatase 5-like [Impatiens glandulifera]|uniref:purple acid phosphatase 5-like n=1 Tax=Impatiens glandulifera TaxID=253017 RepID=UPI001FB05650|nr:purple acid phosphatase 5-like [Impatiens glandulifera]